MSYRTKWKSVTFSEVIQINPRESLAKGTLAKKVGMVDVAENMKNIISFTLEEYKNGPKFRQNDTLFARITPCLENGKISKVNILKNNEIGFGSTEFIIMRAIPGITDDEYVYYLTQWNKVRDPAIKSMTGTSGRQRVQNAVFDQLNFELPPLSEQQDIGKALGYLDDKIENNNAIIANLETQAQAIFKSWFIDFEPFQDGEFEDSELGEIPKGWEVKKLGDFFPVKTGKKNANIATQRGEIPFFTCSQEISYTDDYSFDSHSILLAGNGDFNVKRYKGKFEAYQRTYVLTPYDESIVSILYYLIDYYLSYIVSGFKGSVIRYITKGMIEDFSFPFPSSLDELGLINVFNAIEHNISNLKNQNAILTQLRDTLLPKLMSGEIRVGQDNLEEIETEV